MSRYHWLVLLNLGLRAYFPFVQLAVFAGGKNPPRSQLPVTLMLRYFIMDIGMWNEKWRNHGFH